MVDVLKRRCDNRAEHVDLLRTCRQIYIDLRYRLYLAKVVDGRRRGRQSCQTSSGVETRALQGLFLLHPKLQIAVVRPIAKLVSAADQFVRAFQKRIELLVRTQCEEATPKPKTCHYSKKQLVFAT